MKQDDLRFLPASNDYRKFAELEFGFRALPQLPGKTTTPAQNISY
nr:hypothetical protein [uncultured Corynebacterium sp.]